MARQVINTGSAPDDHTGDPVKTAFDKSNANFVELYALAPVPGPTGATGPQGGAGGAGAPGVTGPIGPTGSSGAAGAAGAASTVTGPTGASGSPGAPGVTGPTGGAGTGGGGGGFTSSSTAPVAPNPGDYWYDLSTGVLSVRINDGNSSQWVKVSPGGGGGNVYAAPFDAMAYSGMQINGSMEISQEFGTTGTSTALKYVVDGFMLDFTGGVTAASAVQVVDGPPGFVNSIKLTIGTSTGAETTVRFLKRIEGTRFSRLAFGTINAQPVTIGFWSKIHRPGLYSVGLRNGNNTRCCALGFTQNVADVWEYKTVTFPGDTTGTWVTDSTSGASVSFCMSVGSAAFITPGVWVAGAAVGVPGMVNILAVTDTFQITGVVILPGIQLPTAAQSPLIMRPFDQELAYCASDIGVKVTVPKTPWTNLSSGAS